jgi:general secretion pathway protein K
MKPQGERGFALLVVLWSLSLITLLTAQLLGSGRTAVHLAGNLRNAAMAQASADGAINEAVFHLVSAGPDAWQADGAPHLLNIGGFIVTVRVDSLAEKINPNLASTGLLAGLFQAEGASPAQAQAQANAIIEWRSPAASKQETESRIAAYRHAGLPYAPPAHGFDDLGELGDVIGIKPALLAAALPEMSLYQSGDPDPSVAGPIVRRALSIAGEAGANRNEFEGNNPVFAIEAEAAASGLAVRRNAVVSIAGPGTPVPYQFLSLTGGY